MKAPIEPGRVVIAKKGRDKGRLFMVLCQVDADYLLMVNGGTRKLEKPKRKRLKHVATIPVLIDERRRGENRHIRGELARLAAQAQGTALKEGYPVVEN